MNKQTNTTELNGVSIPKIILGLDISTHSIGLSVVSVENDEFKVLELKHLKVKGEHKLKGDEALLYKSNIIRDKLSEFSNYHISDIIIEQPSIKLKDDNLVSSTFKFIGMVEQAIYDILHIVPKFITSVESRMFAFPELLSLRKFDKDNGLCSLDKIRNNAKENKVVLFGAYQWDIAKKNVLWNYVIDKFPYIEWIYNKQGELSNENFDTIDSLLSIIGFLKKEKFSNSVPVVKNYREEGQNPIIISYDIDFCDTTIPKRLVYGGENH